MRTKVRSLAVGPIDRDVIVRRCWAFFVSTGLSTGLMIAQDYAGQPLHFIQDREREEKEGDTQR